jgi:putative ABC transport system ATP-binding protein
VLKKNGRSPAMPASEPLYKPGPGGLRQNARPLEAPIIRLRQVRKAYRTAAGEFQALRGIDLDIHTGEFICIMGRSGAGKTTLINMLTGVDRLTSGEVWVQEEPIHLYSEDRLARWRGENLGIIYQSFYLMPTLTLLDNVLLPMDFCNTYRRQASPAWALELLSLVGLADHAHKLPSAISGGQQQRVAIARALVNKPALIVADEPTGRLDSATAELIFQIFMALVEQGKTILMVTHDHNLAERAPRCLQLDDGRLVPAQGISPQRGKAGV